MRVCMRIRIPVETGSQTIMDGTLPKTLESVMGQLKPEAAYFLPQDGLRAAIIFFDLQDSSLIPTITEPLFRELHAKIDISPAMNLNDLQAGLHKLHSLA